MIKRSFNDAHPYCNKKEAAVRRCFTRGFSENLAEKFQENTRHGVSFLIKLHAAKETPARVLSCEVLRNF